MSRGSDWGGCTLPTVSSSEEGRCFQVGETQFNLDSHEHRWSLTDFPNDEREAFEDDQKERMSFVLLRMCLCCGRIICLCCVCIICLRIVVLVLWLYNMLVMWLYNMLVLWLYNVLENCCACAVAVQCACAVAV